MSILDPQTWTIIGVNAAVVFAVIRMSNANMLRVLEAEIARLEGVLGHRLSAVEDDMRLVKARLIGGE